MFQIRKSFLPLEAQFTQINFFISNFLMLCIQRMDVMHQRQIICARIKACQALSVIFKLSRYPRTHPMVSVDSWSRVFWYRGLDLKLRSIWYRKNEQYKYCIDLKCGKYIFQIISVWFSQLSITILMRRFSISFGLLKRVLYFCWYQGSMCRGHDFTGRTSGRLPVYFRWKCHYGAHNFEPRIS